MGTIDAYGLDPDTDWEGVPECDGPHTWGPWVLSPRFANREDRFCTRCGIMEMQWLDDDEPDVVHIQTETGCVISLDGQGHLPCSLPEHQPRGQEPPAFEKSEPLSDEEWHAYAEGAGFDPDAGQEGTDDK